MQDKRDVLVTVNESAALDEVVGGLRQAGLEVTGVMDAVHIVTGRAEQAALAALQQVPHVTAVEESPAFQLPPDGAPQ